MGSVWEKVAQQEEGGEGFCFGRRLFLDAKRGGKGLWRACQLPKFIASLIYL